jgi:hypothetical protein
MYASKSILSRLANGDHSVVVDEWDDTEALVNTTFALRYVHKHKKLRNLNRKDYGGIRRVWSECYDRNLGF